MNDRFIYRIIPCAALATLVPCVTGAQVVSEKVRQERLAAISSVLDAARPDIDELVKNIRDPFAAGISSESAVVAGSDKQTKEEAEVRDLPKKILSEAESQLSPAGLMVNGDKKYVVSADGSIHAVGEPFTMQLNDGPAELKVEAATSVNFILRFKNETMTIKYDQSAESEGSATMARQSP